MLNNNLGFDLIFSFHLKKSNYLCKRNRHNLYYNNFTLCILYALMEDLVNKIDEIFEQLKVSAYGRNLPSGNDSDCNPYHFARCAERFFLEIDKIPSDFWKDREYVAVYDCERLSRHDLSVATLKSCKNQKEIITQYLHQISEIVDMIHRNFKNF